MRPNITQRGNLKFACFISQHILPSSPKKEVLKLLRNYNSTSGACTGLTMTSHQPSIGSQYQIRPTPSPPSPTQISHHPRALSLPRVPHSHFHSDWRTDDGWAHKSWMGHRTNENAAVQQYRVHQKVYPRLREWPAEIFPAVLVSAVRRNISSLPYENLGKTLLIDSVQGRYSCE